MTGRLPNGFSSSVVFQKGWGFPLERAMNWVLHPHFAVSYIWTHFLIFSYISQTE